MTTRVVYWDLGGVLVDVDMDRSRRRWSQETGRSAADFDALLFAGGLKEAVDRGQFDHDELLRRLSDRGIELGSERWASIWNACLIARPRMVALVREVARRATCAVLSNTDPSHAAYISAELGLGDDLSWWMTSYDVASMKPEPAIYRAAIERARVPPESILFVDDRADNVEAARAAGIDAIVFPGYERLLEALASRALTL